MLTARPSSPPLAQEAAGAEGRRSGRGVRHVHVARRVPGPAHCVPKPGVAVTSNVLPRPRPRAARPCRGGRGSVTSSPSPSPSLYTGIGVGAGACSPAPGEAGGQCSRPVSVSRPPTFLCCPAGVQGAAHRAPACLVSLLCRFSNGPTSNGSHNAHSDTSWLSGLSRVDAAPAPSPPVTLASPAPRYAAHPPPPAATSPPAAAPDREDLRALVRDQKRAIEALEAEKASLSASLEHLAQVEQSR